jgi:hypothetical protein
MSAMTYAQAPQAGYQTQSYGGWGDGGGAFGLQGARGPMGAGFGPEQVQQLQAVQQQLAYRIAKHLIRQQIIQLITQQQPGVVQQIEQLHNIQQQAQAHPALQALAQHPVLQQATQQVLQQLIQSGLLQQAQQIAQLVVQQYLSQQQFQPQQQYQPQLGGFGQQGFGQQGFGQQGFGQQGFGQPQMQSPFNLLGIR